MKCNALLLIAVSLFALGTGCSTPTHVDSGPVRGRTFSFIKADRPTPTEADNRQVVHSMIQDAITRNLETRGVKKAESGADLVVAYLVITGDNVTTTTLREHFGYRADATELHEKAHSAYTNSKNPDAFAAGTLVIDVIDAKTFKVLKRGYATRPLLRSLPNDARAARIQEVVDEILRDLRIEA